MKLNEFSTLLQQKNHDFVTDTQKSTQLAAWEITYDQYDWDESYIAWMIRQHRHAEDPVRMESSAATMGPSVDPARGAATPPGRIAPTVKR